MTAVMIRATGVVAVTLSPVLWWLVGVSGAMFAAGVIRQAVRGQLIMRFAGWIRSARQFTGSWVGRARAFVGRWALRIAGVFVAWVARVVAPPFRAGPLRWFDRPTRPLRSLAMLLLTPVRRRTFDRVVGGHRAVAAALSDPLVRVPYRSRLDALEVVAALGEDDLQLSHGMRAALMERMAAAGTEVADRAHQRVDRLARAAVAASRGKLDGVKDLIEPASVAAMVEWMGIADADGEEVFRWAQLTLNRVFLSPNRPTGTHDWLAERSAREARDRFGATLRQVFHREYEMLRTGAGQSLMAQAARRVADRVEMAGDVAETATETGSAAGPAIRPAGAAVGGELPVDEESTCMAFAISLGPHLAWTAALVLDELLRHPRATRAAFAGRSGRVTDPNDPRLLLVLEALRFSPPAPGLVRISSSRHPLLTPTPPGTGADAAATRSTGSCPFSGGATDRDATSDPTEVAGQSSPVTATPDEPRSDRRPVRRIGAGNVLVFTMSSDFDAARTEHPLRFRPGRFRRDTHSPVPPIGYPMAFGGGRHACLGVEIAPELIVSMLGPLLTCQQVRRARGHAGRLSTQLPVWSPMRDAGTWALPTSMTIELDNRIAVTPSPDR